MKVYLAHNYAAKEWLRGVKERFVKCGIEVTSRWIEQAQDIDPYHPDVQIDEAQKDVQDVLRADALILFTDNFGDRPGRGKYVELGMAIASRKKIILCGKEHKNTVFYFLPSMIHCDNVEDVLHHLTDHMFWMTQP